MRRRRKGGTTATTGKTRAGTAATSLSKTFRPGTRRDQVRKRPRTRARWCLASWSGPGWSSSSSRASSSATGSGGRSGGGATRKSTSTSSPATQASRPRSRCCPYRAWRPPPGGTRAWTWARRAWKGASWRASSRPSTATRGPGGGRALRGRDRASSTWGPRRPTTRASWTTGGRWWRFEGAPVLVT